MQTAPSAQTYVVYVRADPKDVWGPMSPWNIWGFAHSAEDAMDHMRQAVLAGHVARFERE